MQPIPDHELSEQWMLEIHPDLLVINKPAGLSVLRDRSGEVDLWQRLTAQYGKLYQVHRLDKATSGLLLVARSQALQSNLTRHFANRSARKTYCAVVHGALSLAGTGCIDLPLRKGRKSRYRVAAQRDTIVRSADEWHVADSDNGVEATTKLRRLNGKVGWQQGWQGDSKQNRTRLALRPLTGRTHQLRVHLAWIGHAIVGDPLYGTSQTDPSGIDQLARQRMLLHAARLTIPGVGSWSAPLDSAWDH